MNPEGSTVSSDSSDTGSEPRGCQSLGSGVSLEGSSVSLPGLMECQSPKGESELRGEL